MAQCWISRKLHPTFSICIFFLNFFYPIFLSRTVDKGEERSLKIRTVLLGNSLVLIIRPILKHYKSRQEQHCIFYVNPAELVKASSSSSSPPSRVWWFGSRPGQTGVSGFHRLSVGGQLQLHQPSESRSAPPGHQPRHHHRTFTSVQLRLLGFSQSLRSGEHAPPVR